MIDIPVVATLLSLSPHFNISIQSLASVDTSILLAFIPCSMVNTFFPIVFVSSYRLLPNVLHTYFYAIYRTVSFRALLQREDRRIG